MIRILDGAPTEPADVVRIRVMMDEALLRSPTIGMISIVHHGTPIASPATIRYAKQLMGELEERLVIGVALIGMGFWAQAGQTMLEFLSRIANRRSTFATGDSVEVVAERMALELVGLEAEQLCLACAELERRLRGRSE